jgi:competence protein ComEC
MSGRYLYFAISAFLGLLCVLISFLPFLFLFFFYLFLLHKYKRFTHKHLMIIIVFAFIFMMIGKHEAAENKSKLPESTSSFLLQYIEDPKIDGDLLQIQTKEKRYNEKLILRYSIKSEKEKEYFQNQTFYGVICQVSGTMSKPKISKNPNGFNYRRYLESKQIFWIVEADQNPLLFCKRESKSLLTSIKQLRFSGIRYLEKNFPIEIASLSAALIFGDRELFYSDVLEDYQKTGIVHLLAISGLHVSLLIGMVYYLGIRAGLTRQFMINCLLLILPIYVLLTGATPSVIRAALMIFLVLFVKKWDKHLHLVPIDAISLTFIIYVFIQPMIIFDIGFQLSFSVSFAIILSAQQVLNEHQNSWMKLLATSIVAQLAAMPFLLYHFFELSLIGVFANIVYIPLFSFVYLPAVYFLFFFQLMFDKTPSILTYLMNKIITIFNKVISWIGDLHFAAFVPGKPNLFFLLFYVLTICLIFYIWETKKGPNWKKKVLGLLIILFTIQPTWNWLRPFGEITMIDVGQGDSILIHLPFRNGTYLIDTGGTVNFNEDKWRQRSKPFEVGRDVVVPFLKGKGITTIDKLILTHGDMDHVGGAVSIINELKVKEILLPSVADPSDAEHRIMKLANKKKIPVRKVYEGNSWRNKYGQFYILAPEKNFVGERNGGSIAIFAIIGGLTWYFGGDLDIEGEQKIIKNYPNLNIDVIKVGHHGSKTSSSKEFLQKTTPQIALISVGENNRFGHPHQEVLNRLNEKKITIYRTDMHGAVTYRFFRGKGTFLPYLP